MKRLASMIISIILLITPSLAEEGSEKDRTVQDMIEELAVYYGTYGSKAEEKATELLEELVLLILFREQSGEVSCSSGKR